MFSVEMNRALSSLSLHNLGYKQTTPLEGVHPSRRPISFVPFKKTESPFLFGDPNVRPT